MFRAEALISVNRLLRFETGFDIFQLALITENRISTADWNH